MSALLRAELLKLRTTRTFVALVATALLLSLLIVVLSVLLQSDFDETDVRQLFTSDLSPLFILLLGVMGLAGEWRHRTITRTILAAPDRVRLLAAKLLAYAAAGALLSLIVTIAIMAVGSLLLTIDDKTTIGLSELADVLWRNLLVAALLGALGLCIGGLVRNQAVAIIGVLIVAFFDPILFGLAPDVGRYMPFLSAPSAISGGDSGDTELLSEAAAVLVMLGWTAALFVLTTLSLRRRDLV